MIRQLGTLLCVALLLAACGASEGGEPPAPGGQGGDGGNDGSSCTQDRCMEGAGDYSKVNEICLPGGCTEVGSRDEFGDIRRGAMVIGLVTERIDARLLMSCYVRIFYPQDTRGEAVDCNRIFATPNRLDSTLNVVGYQTFSIRSEGYRDLAVKLGPVYDLPVNDASTPYVVHIGLFAGDRDSSTLDPTGPMLVEGCLGGMVVPEGPIEDLADPDPIHWFSGLVANRIP